METIIPQKDNSFVYSCTSKDQWGYEQFISEHILAFQLSGETHIFHQQGIFVLKKGRMLLARRNQFAKSLKITATDNEYKAVSIILKTEDLKKYAAINNIVCDKKYSGKNNMVLKPDSYLKSYFQSLIPYLEQPEVGNSKMIFSKITEAIELLLNVNPDFKNLLFDFTEPHKIDLEDFMQHNYHYNVPIENFAKLTGRSIAAFKRDFIKVFNLSPAKWLKEMRLKEAYRLIHQDNKRPPDIYLDLGFENLSHFYTAFKNKYGVTPTESLKIKK
ncbi:AraC family transcriptional regulator [Sphingobacterium sp. UME9]|uniref:helix-turn-helix domain-containing protein n=1 Tax=Sphingobacterium sp. UME9 TaxID=1862316 RepID=UPI0015FED9E4|nr:AraC family transcriptional regulator [Sphingobacterium sp. UME9]MBB1643192.1 AraC family transcriptional regulator [Sphingobacterium sp. UME9]